MESFPPGGEGAIIIIHVGPAVPSSRRRSSEGVTVAVGEFLPILHKWVGILIVVVLVGEVSVLIGGVSVLIIIKLIIT